MKKCRIVVLALIFSVAIFIGSAYAGGLFLYEAGTPLSGTASAGWAAAAKDASIAITNPAGMTKLEESQLLVGSQPMYVSLEFDPASSGNTFGTADGGNAGGFAPAGAIFYVHKLNDTASLGVTFGSFFGGAMDYQDNWAGRYHVQEFKLPSVTLSPAAAIKINDWLSVGAGFNVTYANFYNKSAVNNVLDGIGDGQIEYDDGAFGFGGDFGVLWEPKEGTRFGVTYYLPMDFEFEDELEMRDIGPTLQAGLVNNKLWQPTIEINMTVPQAIMVSGYHELTEKLAIMANFSWQDFSEFGRLGLAVPSATPVAVTVDLNLEDVWHGAIGAHYRINDTFLLMGGFAYDSSMVSDTNRTVMMPFDRALRYAGGLQWEKSDDETLTFSYEFIDMGDAEVNSIGTALTGNMVGEYDPNMINTVSISYNRKF